MPVVWGADARGCRWMNPQGFTLGQKTYSHSPLFSLSAMPGKKKKGGKKGGKKGRPA